MDQRDWNAIALRQVREWEDLFFSLYERKPKMIEREQYFLGKLQAMQAQDQEGK